MQWKFDSAFRSFSYSLPQINPHYPFPFCLLTPTFGLALTFSGIDAPFTPIGPPLSSLSAFSIVDGRLRLFWTFGLALALVTWLPVPPLVLVPCWLGCVTMPTLVGGCCICCICCICGVLETWLWSPRFCIAGDILRVAGEVPVELTGRFRWAAWAGDRKWGGLAPEWSWRLGFIAAWVCCGKPEFRKEPGGVWSNWRHICLRASLGDSCRFAWAYWNNVCIWNIPSAIWWIFSTGLSS